MNQGGRHNFCCCGALFEYETKKTFFFFLSVVVWNFQMTTENALDSLLASTTQDVRSKKKKVLFFQDLMLLNFIILFSFRTSFFLNYWILVYQQTNVSVYIGSVYSTSVIYWKFLKFYSKNIEIARWFVYRIGTESV